MEEIYLGYSRLVSSMISMRKCQEEGHFKQCSMYSFLNLLDKNIMIIFYLLAGLQALNTPLKKVCSEILNKHLLQGQKWNKTYSFCRPGLQKYGPYQWLWDSSFHIIAWSQIDFTRGIRELRTLLKMQQPSGKIPQMIFWGNGTAKDYLLNYLINHQQKTTRITQMPMLPFALYRLFEETLDLNIITQFLPALVKYHRWWMTERQPDKDGLVVIIHPWESGLDASPLYDEALGVKNPQPTLKELYPQFYWIELSYSFNYFWDETKIVNNKQPVDTQPHKRAFVFKDVGVNSVYTYGWLLLSKLAKQINDLQLSHQCLVHYKHFLNGVKSLWDQKELRFMSKYRSNGKDKLAKANTVQGLFPLLLDIQSNQRKALLDMLKSTEHYNLTWPIPTVSKSDPAFRADFTIDLMWRGPTWAAPNYFILSALYYRGHIEQFKYFGKKYVQLSKQKGIFEMYNPLTGQGMGVKQLGMSTSVVDIEDKILDLEQIQISKWENSQRSSSRQG